jgi:hypothetical protein
MSKKFIDHESIHNRLFLLGTTAGTMADYPETYGDKELYGMQSMLYALAAEVWPHAGTDEPEGGAA